MPTINETVDAPCRRRRSASQRAASPATDPRRTRRKERPILVRGLDGKLDSPEHALARAQARCNLAEDNAAADADYVCLWMGRCYERDETIKRLRDQAYKALTPSVLPAFAKIPEQVKTPSMYLWANATDPVAPARNEPDGMELAGGGASVASAALRPSDVDAVRSNEPRFHLMRLS